MKARELQQGMCFTYVGAFARYWAGEDAKGDSGYPGKILIRGCCRATTERRQVVLDIRLDAEQEVEVEDP